MEWERKISKTDKKKKYLNKFYVRYDCKDETSGSYHIAHHQTKSYETFKQKKKKKRKNQL